MPVNYQALRAGAGAAQIPADGSHQARLDRGALVSTSKGERLVTEWSTTDGCEWQSWNRFDQTGLEYTRELLLGLGVDLEAVSSDEELNAALDRVAGFHYEVRTNSTQGSQGDKTFTNTYVDGRALGEQQALAGGNGDLPIDTSDLEKPDGPDDDETIPF